MKYAIAIALCLASLVAVSQGLPDGVTDTSDSVQATTYPATFPWENDSFKASTVLPNFDKIEELDPEMNDIGGYAAIALATCNPFLTFPFGWFTGHTCGYVVYRMFYGLWQLPIEDFVPLNCSMANSVVTEGPIRGDLVGTSSVCGNGECCTRYFGRPLYSREWDASQEKWDQRAPKFGCVWLSEESYCLLLFFSFGWCRDHLEYSVDGSDRPVLHPCISLMSFYLSQCSTFKSQGAKALIEAINTEPEDYVNSLTAEEANTVIAVFYANDHVCIPLSEIDASMWGAPSPTAAAPTDAADSPTAAAASPTAAAATSADDSAAWAFAPSALFAAVAVFAGLF